MAKKSIDRETTNAAPSWRSRYKPRRDAPEGDCRATASCRAEERFAAQLKLSELPRNSSIADADSQPLRADRSAARLLSQIQVCRASPARARLGQGRSPACSSRAGKDGDDMSDPLGDMLTRIRNAQRARHAVVTTPASNFARTCSMCCRAKAISAASCARVDCSGRHCGARDRAEICRRRAGDQGDQARVSTPGRRFILKVADLPTRL
jgi:small subunit ribosomal protein S8